LVVGPQQAVHSIAEPLGVTEVGLAAGDVLLAC
jgi:hypothetical protein